MSHQTTFSPKACRAARAWLGWKAADLAARAGLTLRHVQRIETGQGGRLGREKILRAFSTAGVTLLSDGLHVEPVDPPSDP